jgi:DNA modification methylase
LHFSNCPQDGIVVDLFAGTGSTAKAAYSVSRQFYGCEKDADCSELANESLLQYLVSSKNMKVWTDAEDSRANRRRSISNADTLEESDEEKV